MPLSLVLWLAGGGGRSPAEVEGDDGFVVDERGGHQLQLFVVHFPAGELQVAEGGVDLRHRREVSRHAEPLLQGMNTIHTYIGVCACVMVALIRADRRLGRYLSTSIDPQHSLPENWTLLPNNSSSQIL